MVGAIPGRHRITIGFDKAYDTQDFVATKETVKRMPSAKANEPNRPVKQELFLRSKVATWRLFARLLSKNRTGNCSTR